MAEEIENELINIKTSIKGLQNAIPKVITPSEHKEGLDILRPVATSLAEIKFDESFEDLADVLSDLIESNSNLLKTVTFQGFLLDILEMLTEISSQVQGAGLPKETAAYDLTVAGEFILRLAQRATNRYRLNVNFEPDYEAKSIRAFMVIKELRPVAKFLNISPDISENQTANLDGGLEIDLLSTATPELLHQIAGSVLEVKSVQIFTETKNQQVLMLDPPQDPDSFDIKMDEYVKS